MSLTAPRPRPPPPLAAGVVVRTQNTRGKKKLEVGNLLSADNTARFKHRSPPALVSRSARTNHQPPCASSVFPREEKTEAIHAGCPVLEPGSPGERNRDWARSLVSHHPLAPPCPHPLEARSFVPFGPKRTREQRRGPSPRRPGAPKSLAQPWGSRSTAGILPWALYT